MINVNGKEFPLQDQWTDPQGMLKATYFTRSDGVTVLTREYDKSKFESWDYKDPRDAVVGFIAISTNLIGKRAHPPTYNNNKKNGSRGHNHSAIRKLAGNKCQMPDCDWPKDPRLSCDIHHIIPVKDGGDESMANKICLCKNCHAEADLGLITIDELFKLNGTYDND